MGTLQDKITSFLLKKAEYHHCGDEEVIYVDSNEQAEELAKEIIQIVNEYING